MAVRRPSHLAFAVICLALLHLLAHTGTGEHHNPSMDAAAVLLVASGAPPMAAGWPACSDHLRAPSAVSNPSRTRFSAVSPEPEDANEAVASSVHAVPMAREQDTLSSATGCLLHMRAPAVKASEPARRGATRAAKIKPLVINALPLLAVPFLPPPLAALLALSSLAAPARARSEEDCSKLTHASCAVYDYDNDTATVDRRRPHPGLNAQCEHPICRAKTHERAVLHAVRHGRRDDPLLIFCSVRVVENPPPSILPWKNVWVTQIPVPDPAAAAASGERICFVELVHLGYREGYYIRCPKPSDMGSHSSCTVFLEQEGAGEIAAAVRDHRRLNYRRTVWPKYVTPTTDKHDEL